MRFWNLSKFVCFVVFVFQLQTCLPQSHWKNQKRHAEPVAAARKETATLIFLHGLGDTGDHWVPRLAAISQPHVKIISPTADVIPVTINHGSKMTAWFDIKGVDSTSVEDVEGIRNASRFVHTLVDAEIKKGTPADRIVIGGFSQGGALALYSGLTYRKKLAAIVALSCWLPLSTVFTPQSVIANRNIRILQCHGQLDTVVPFAFGQLTAFVLARLTNNFEFKTYPGLMHTVSPPEMTDIGNFLRYYLPPQNSTTTT